MPSLIARLPDLSGFALLARMILTIVCIFLGSLLVTINRHTWLGAGALALFTALTIPIAHDFWTMTGEKARTELRRTHRPDRRPNAGLGLRATKCAA